jgi:multiple sugar transport system substrate-binding protein
VTADAKDFEMGKTALSWMGHWGYISFKEKLGKDLVVMPLPDFGRGIKTGMGSIMWGMSSTCAHPDATWKFLANYLLTPEMIVRTSNLTAGIPARRSALAVSPLYGPNGPLRPILRQLEVGGVPRPLTPSFDAISKAFGTAVTNIAAGGDVQSELSKAADIIDQTLAEKQGRPYR